MSTTPIPKHSLSEKFQGELFFLWRLDEIRDEHPVDYAHRDDYYMFAFLERGRVKLAIDFEEHEITAPVVAFIRPEQVHLLLKYEGVRGWMLVVDKMLVNDHCKEVFECASLDGGGCLSADVVRDLTCCMGMLDRRVNPRMQDENHELVQALMSLYIGIIADVFQHASPVGGSKRAAEIVARFRILLAANYRTMKRPSHYAAALNISPIYLNEVVRRVMDKTVTAAIHNEIITHAKRLLFYTSLTVKEVAFELGYDDCAYFTRLFSQVAAISPTRFRVKYHK